MSGPETPLELALRRLELETPELVARLRTTLDLARGEFEGWLDERRRGLRHGIDGAHPLDEAKARECLEVLDSLVSERHERRVGFSTFALLHGALGRSPSILTELDEGFVLEFIHLFRGVSGRSGTAAGWRSSGAQPPSLELLRGREAAIARSEALDEIGREMWSRVRAHPSGLDPGLIAERSDNRARILAHLGAGESQWDDHEWQLEHTFKGPDALDSLGRLVALSDTDREAIAACIEHAIPFGITPHYLSLFDFSRSDRARDGQVRSQMIPPLFYIRSFVDHLADRRSYFDFMGEADTSPLELVTRRYPAVAILKALDTCPQICVYCQRNFEIGSPMEPDGFPNVSTIEAGLDWFADHPAITDVLVTGGDPIFHDDAQIAAIMERIQSMEHVTHVRWGTRAPVTVPMRITSALVATLAGYVQPGRRAVSLVTHVETAAEVTPDMVAAVDRLRRAGISVYNQQVFTVQTSRRFQSVACRVALKKAGIDPYYTFVPKAKEETRDYATPIARIAQERKEEARLLPGMFRTDEPVFNVPRLGKNHIRSSRDRELIAIQADGRRVYLWHPWEKGITRSDAYQHVDVPIREYLDRMERLGETREDYASIWYYY